MTCCISLSPNGVALIAGRGPFWELAVYSAGFCNLTSAQVLRQLGQNRGRADIARVQDEVRSAQFCRHTRRAGPPPPGGVSIGQHDDPHEVILRRRVTTEACDRD